MTVKRNIIKILRFNKHEEIKELFKSFQQLLVPEKNEITEENFTERNIQF
jgi:hypothetical protein